ncbi:hypothetical protein EVG20_g11523, partial [Dentipellis fragilis]
MDEDGLADEFYGFLTQFYSVFPELVKKKLFITGESYAGMYIPYIATRILQATAAEQAALPLALQGLLINDGVYSSFVVDQEAPAAQFAKANQQALGLSDSEVARFANLSASCGYDDMLAQVTYPPKAKILLPGNSEAIPSNCEIWGDMAQDGYGSNPCFNVYRYTDKCPEPSDDPLGTYFSVSTFMRSDLQETLHIPNAGEFLECSNVFPNGDFSPYSERLLPDLLAKLPRGITLWHGLLDALLLNMGDRLTIQNLTWNGAQGFSAPPTTPLVVGGSQKGVYHSERNLTYVEVDGAGHMIPEDQPETALHVLQAVLVSLFVCIRLHLPERAEAPQRESSSPVNELRALSGDRPSRFNYILNNIPSIIISFMSTHESTQPTGSGQGSGQSQHTFEGQAADTTTLTAFNQDVVSTCQTIVQKFREGLSDEQRYQAAEVYLNMLEEFAKREKVAVAHGQQSSTDSHTIDTPVEAAQPDQSAEAQPP